VWRNAIGLAEDAVTLGSVMKQAGYSTNYIGKWHLAPPTGAPDSAESRGPVKPQHRAGFRDLWEAANALEWTSQPYEGDLFDGRWQADPLRQSVSRRFHDRSRPAFPSLAGRQIAISADAFLPRSPSPER